jgi:cation diffusion facilitator CzcD-associated flavoprotein CzcO
MFGRPTDVLHARARKNFPKPIVQPMLQALIRLGMGRWEKYGLQPPRCRPLEMHLTLSTSILNALRHGTVLPRKGIERFEGEIVHFCDGTSEPLDTIIWATGFKTSFPFFDATVVDWDTSLTPPLYLRMMHPRFANLYFLGLFQPLGCVWRLADYQARIAALQIAARLERPADIDARIDDEIRSPHWHFEATPRHAIQVDGHEFRRALFKELGRAREQAAT